MMNIIVKKKIGSGVNGTVYHGKCGEQNCVIKVEKFDGDLGLKTEVVFSAFANKYPHFMHLIYYSVMANCDHEQLIPDYVSKSHKQELKQKNKITSCSLLGYVPVMQYSWRTHQPTELKPFCEALYQLVDSIDLMRNNNFVHADIHENNIMYNDEAKRWCLIDYGSVSNLPKEYNWYDLTSLIRTIIVDKYADRMIKYKIKFPTYVEAVKVIKSNRTAYKDIKLYLPKTRNAHALDEAIMLVCLIRHYPLYMMCLGCKDVKKYERDISVQKYPDILLYMIVHLFDDNYKKIKTMLKRKMKTV